MSNNVNSSNSFNEPYIYHSHNDDAPGLQISSSTFALSPITVARRYQHDEFEYNQHKVLMHQYSNDLAKLKHTKDVPKSLISRYRRNIVHNRLAYLKLNLRIQKYRAYLNKLPARNMQSPSWWMYL